MSNPSIATTRPPGNHLTPHASVHPYNSIILFLFSLWVLASGKLNADVVTFLCPYPAFIIQSYGVVLAPLPTEGDQVDLQGNLSRTLGSVVGTACLRAETRVGPQLVSHVFGLLKARNIEGLSEEDRWLSSDEGTEWVIRTVDKIHDVARGGSQTAEAKL